MRYRKYARLLVWVLAILLAIGLAGCGDSNRNGGTIDEPAITVQYLSEDFSQQLIRDGGEEILGTVELKEEGEGKYAVTVNSMAIIESAASDGGYYIADKNLSTTVPLDMEARATYIDDKKKGAQLMELDEFIKKVQEDSQAASESEENEKLYDVYIIGGQALMLLARELPDK